MTRPSSFDHEQLLACGRGELFGDGNARLPSPPMLMFDRITRIASEDGAYGKGLIHAEMDIHPALWFFGCHFIGDPVLPGCLGLDAMWQLSGFFLPWLGEPGRGRATTQFDAMGALSTGYNDTPQRASRPYDAGRDGFVIAGGGGMLVLEEYEHARARGARIHGELVGYGVTSDGADMVAPSGEGAVRCMRMALANVSAPVDYLNTHGTATPLGDIVELQSVREVFGDAVPPLSSTKSLTGHALGAASVHEAIYSLLMLNEGFIAGSAHIDELDPRAEGFPIVRSSRPAPLATLMSNSFGFGATNASLVFAKV